MLIKKSWRKKPLLGPRPHILINELCHLIPEPETKPGLAELRIRVNENEKAACCHIKRKSIPVAFHFLGKKFAASDLFRFGQGHSSSLTCKINGKSFKIASVNIPVYQTFGMTETISHVALKRLNGDNMDAFYELLPGWSMSTDESGRLSLYHQNILSKTVQTNDLVRKINDNSFKEIVPYRMNSG